MPLDLLDQSGFADPRLAPDLHRLAHPIREASCEDALKLLQFGSAADERSLGRAPSRADRSTRKARTGSL